MPLVSVAQLVRSLLSSLPDTSAAVITVKTGRPGHASRSNNAKTEPNRPVYDPGLVYILELATVLALRDNDTVEELGEELTTSLQTIIRDANNLHPLTLTRVIHYLLSSLRRSYVCTLRRNRSLIR